MKTKHANTLILVAVATGTALVAYAMGVNQHHEPILTLFLAFFAAILAIQLVPAGMLLSGMLKAVFARTSRTEKKLER